MEFKPDFQDLNDPGTIYNHVESLKKENDKIKLVDTLPDTLKEIVKATKESLNFPEDYTASAMLYAFSVANGNTIRIKVKSSFEQNSVIFIALVGESGINKSHPLSFAIEPLKKYDAERYKEYEIKYAEYEAKRNLSNKERQEEGLESLEKPHWKRFLMSDFTPESLIKVHKFNQRGIGVYVDELMMWIRNFDRYNKGSEQQMWLSSWSGKEIRLDRIKSEPIFIGNPHISVAGTLQTKLLAEIAKGNRNNDGFMERLLFTIPQNLKKKPWTKQQLDKAYKDEYAKAINKIITLSYSGNPKVLTMNSKAEKLLYEYQRNLTDFSNSNKEYASICSKIELYAVRLSLISEVMLYACGDSELIEISEEAVKNGILMAEYFKENAIWLYENIYDSNPVDKLTTKYQNFYNNLPEEFTTKEALELSKKFKISTRSTKYFLSKNKDKLFENLDRGVYKKIL